MPPVYAGGFFVESASEILVVMHRIFAVMRQKFGGDASDICGNRQKFGGDASDICGNASDILW